MRFHNAGHKNVKFLIVTNNESNAQRIRGFSRQLDVVVVDTNESTQFTRFEDRSIYIFDSCGRIVYIIHFPYSTVLKPFVKAAVLSTIYDKPCGYCDLLVCNVMFVCEKNQSIEIEIELF